MHRIVYSANEHQASFMGWTLFQEYSHEECRGTSLPSYGAFGTAGMGEQAVKKQ